MQRAICLPCGRVGGVGAVHCCQRPGGKVRLAWVLHEGPRPSGPGLTLDMAFRRCLLSLSQKLYVPSAPAVANVPNCRAGRPAQHGGSTPAARRTQHASRGRQHARLGTHGHSRRCCKGAAGTHSRSRRGCWGGVPGSPWGAPPPQPHCWVHCGVLPPPPPPHHHTHTTHTPSAASCAHRGVEGDGVHAVDVLVLSVALEREVLVIVAVIHVLHSHPALDGACTAGGCTQPAAEGIGGGGWAWRGRRWQRGLRALRPQKTEGRGACTLSSSARQASRQCTHPLGTQSCRGSMPGSAFAISTGWALSSTGPGVAAGCGRARAARPRHSARSPWDRQLLCCSTPLARPVHLSTPPLHLPARLDRLPGVWRCRAVELGLPLTGRPAPPPHPTPPHPTRFQPCLAAPPAAGPAGAAPRPISRRRARAAAPTCRLKMLICRSAVPTAMSG